MEHLPYIRDLTPCDFHFFGPLKKHLEGRHFRTDAEVQEAGVKWLRDLDPDFVYAGFDKLVRTDGPSASTTMVTMWKNNMYQ
ncbi:hypothetical protein AVEN_184695-1 [Araneus ventricosus]|uniref:Uncharacterized protein n=1 Tax=Araneus ventricosus TaxID=182803 RepID=A0A4Y2L5K4_ARAVE|nr:hypothetical protein AVEN_184695-1 [Araneus ventricosus]